jgi:hypothetical protein
MEKGTYVIMTGSYTTSCGKEYEKNHIGLLIGDIESAPYVDVRFPIHSSYNSSYIPVSKFIEAPDQDKAEKLFNKGVELCKKVFYK